jgi:hypothetical protein
MRFEESSGASRLNCSQAGERVRLASPIVDLRCWTTDIGVTTGFLGIAGGRFGDDVRPGAYRRSIITSACNDPDCSFLP